MSMLPLEKVDGAFRMRNKYNQPMLNSAPYDLCLKHFFASLILSKLSSFVEETGLPFAVGATSLPSLKHLQPRAPVSASKKISLILISVIRPAHFLLFVGTNLRIVSYRMSSGLRLARRDPTRGFGTISFLPCRDSSGTVFSGEHRAIGGSPFARVRR